MFGSSSINGWSLLLLLSGIGGSGLFAWGVRGHFVGDKTPGAMQVIVAVSFVGIAVFLFDLWDTSVTDWRAVAGFCLHLLAIALFGWAVLATRQKRPAMAFSGDDPRSRLPVGAVFHHPPPFLYVLSTLLAGVRDCDVVAYSFPRVLVASGHLHERGARRGAQFLAFRHQRRIRSVSESDGILLAEAQAGATSAPVGLVSLTRPNWASSFLIMLSATIVQFGSSIMSWATFSKTSGSTP